MLENGVLNQRRVDKGKRVMQLVLPRKYWHLVLVSLHNKVGHLGIERTTDSVQERFHWPFLGRDVKQVLYYHLRDLCFFLPQNDVHRNRKKRAIKTVQGIRKLRSIKTISGATVAVRNLSCFCDRCIRQGSGTCANYTSMMVGPATTSKAGVGLVKFLLLLCFVEFALHFFSGGRICIACVLPSSSMRIGGRCVLRLLGRFPSWQIAPAMHVRWQQRKEALIV